MVPCRGQLFLEVSERHIHSPRAELILFPNNKALQRACPLVGHTHVRERRKSSLCSCSCHPHHYKCSNVFEETFLLRGLYVLRVKARLQPTGPLLRQLLLSAKQLSAWPRASSENPWLRANFNGGTGGCNWLSQLHTSPMALRVCLPPCRIMCAPVHRCRLQAVHGQGCSS